MTFSHDWTYVTNCLMFSWPDITACSEIPYVHTLQEGKCCLCSFCLLITGVELHQKMASQVVFLVCVGAIQMLGLSATILVGVWRSHYRGGYDWGAHGTEKQFNYHPLFMVMAMVFLYSEGNYEVI